MADEGGWPHGNPRKAVKVRGDEISFTIHVRYPVTIIIQREVCLTNSISLPLFLSQHIASFYSIFRGGTLPVDSHEAERVDVEVSCVILMVAVACLNEVCTGVSH